MSLSPTQETIAAVATPVGEGGLAVIRISGPDAIRCAEACFRPSNPQAGPLAAMPSHSVRHGFIQRGDRVIDEVLLTLFRAPRSYTCEDTVELSCHGGLVVTRQVLEGVLAAGARFAQPGEFTQRAFLNGRLDLAQAEAVNDLIHARTELAASAALAQLGGSLSRRIEAVREDLMRVLAHLEAHLDFPDEDIAPDQEQVLLSQLDKACAELDALTASAWEGRILRTGLRLAIVGKPNVGKSSLLNRLLGFDRAIVAPIPGTTRDTIEESAQIRGIPIVLVDTAGVRESSDWVEQEGIRRSRQAEMDADLILEVFDGTDPAGCNAFPQTSADRAEPNRLFVINKVDLGLHWSCPENWAPIRISCLTGEGLEELKSAIESRVWGGGLKRERLEFVVNARQQDALRRARVAVAATCEALIGQRGLEVAALELRGATQAVGEVVGRTTVEDLLDKIFSTFCLGK